MPLWLEIMRSLVISHGASHSQNENSNLFNAIGYNNLVVHQNNIKIKLHHVKEAPIARAYPGFYIAWSNWQYCYFPLDGTLVHPRVTPRSMSLVPFYTPGWREALKCDKVYCPRKNMTAGTGSHTTDLQIWKSNPLTTTPLHLTHQNNDITCWSPYFGDQQPSPPTWSLRLGRHPWTSEQPCSLTNSVFSYY